MTKTFENFFFIDKEQILGEVILRHKSELKKKRSKLTPSINSIRNNGKSTC